MGVPIAGSPQIHVEDVAAMLDPILIHSSNNADKVDELREVVAALKDEAQVCDVALTLCVTLHITILQARIGCTG